MKVTPLEKLDHCLLGRDARFAECAIECAHCGWNDEVAAQRKRIPLRWCEDGLRRKLLPPRPVRNEEGS